MTLDVRQWLTEIKTLQQKLTEVQRERDEAYTSAANWRSLYETEAQQRRTEANLSRQALEEMQAEVDELRSLKPEAENSAETQATVQQTVAQLQTVEALQAKLTEALLECDRLTQALKTEQDYHAQTRKSLTTALGDTMEILTKERATRGSEAMSAPAVTNKAALPQANEVRNPLLELPLTDQIQSRI